MDNTRRASAAADGPGDLPASPPGSSLREAPVLERRDLELTLETHRRELTAYAYRMLGSTFEAEDAVQETFLRAWRAAARFEGRASLRSWLYRIATNVCLDMLEGDRRRARPMDLRSAGLADAALLGDPLPEVTWIEPMPDDRVLPVYGTLDPAEMTVARESIRLAFIAALQHLPPRQRVVLILREVLGWKAAEVADLLDATVPSVNSALQRARATLQERDLEASALPEPAEESRRSLLARYVQAFEQYDIERLTTLLREDAIWNMPPYGLWLHTHVDIREWCLGPGIGCRGSRLIPTSANGAPAYGQYRPAPGGGWKPWALQVLELSGNRIAGVTFFLDTARFYPLFGLPSLLPAREG